MKACIIVNNGLEECEALVTYDLLYRAGIETDLVGFTDEVTSSHNVTFKAHKLLDNISSDDYDCLILPGGMPGTTHLEDDQRVQKLIDEYVENRIFYAPIPYPYEEIDNIDKIIEEIVTTRKSIRLVCEENNLSKLISNT